MNESNSFEKKSKKCLIFSTKHRFSAETCIWHLQMHASGVISHTSPPSPPLLVIHSLCALQLCAFRPIGIRLWLTARAASWNYRASRRSRYAWCVCWRACPCRGCGDVVKMRWRCGVKNEWFSSLRQSFMIEIIEGHPRKHIKKWMIFFAKAIIHNQNSRGSSAKTCYKMSDFLR